MAGAGRERHGCARRTGRDVPTGGRCSRVDAAGATLLEACDAAGRYVPRLCCYQPAARARDVHGRAATARRAVSAPCAWVTGPVRSLAAPRPPTACEWPRTTRSCGRLRLERLAAILARHPHVCLSCPDREGCSRDQCTYGQPSGGALLRRAGPLRARQAGGIRRPPVLTLPRRAVSRAAHSVDRGPHPARTRALRGLRAVRARYARRLPEARQGAGDGRRGRRTGGSAEARHPAGVGLHFLRAVRLGLPDRGLDRSGRRRAPAGWPPAGSKHGPAGPGAAAGGREGW